LKKLTTKNYFEKRASRTQLIEIRGEIEENEKFNSQLRVNLHKSKTYVKKKKR
jgi:hypothetical protein